MDQDPMRFSYTGDGHFVSIGGKSAGEHVYVAHGIKHQAQVGDTTNKKFKNISQSWNSTGIGVPWHQWLLYVV